MRRAGTARRPRRSSASASSAISNSARPSPSKGAQALQSQKRGPKTHYRRTAELERQVIRHRFLDPEASPQVIAQKLVQGGWKISIRSVERVLADYGLQKKTPQIPPRAETAIASWRRSAITWPGPSTAIRSASNAACGNAWPTRSATIWPASGCWFPNTFAWERGTCFAPGRARRAERMEPRLALQLVHEAALCSNGLREGAA